MNEIKYEPVFGDQSLFDNAPLGTELVGHSGGFYKNSPDGPIYCGGCTFTTDEYRNIGFIAARRIIRTPVWTVSDQKEGRLPEVGCEVMVSPKTKATVTAVDSIQKVVAVQCDDESLDILRPCEILPIETEAERQQRVRDNWCADANKLIAADKDYRSESAIIYDALQSGDLPVPVKGE